MKSSSKVFTDRMTREYLQSIKLLEHLFSMLKIPSEKSLQGRNSLQNQRFEIAGPPWVRFIFRRNTAFSNILGLGRIFQSVKMTPKTKGKTSNSVAIGSSSLNSNKINILRTSTGSQHTNRLHSSTKIQNRPATDEADGWRIERKQQKSDLDDGPSLFIYLSEIEPTTETKNFVASRIKSLASLFQFVCVHELRTLNSNHTMGMCICKWKINPQLLGFRVPYFLHNRECQEETGGTHVYYKKSCGPIQGLCK